MDLIARRAELQERAKDLAIEECALREQLDQLRAVEAQAIRVSKEKHLVIGAICMLNEAIKAAEPQKAEE